jgi:hypothetical protein
MTSTSSSDPSLFGFIADRVETLRKTKSHCEAESIQSFLAALPSELTDSIHPIPSDDPRDVLSWFLSYCGGFTPVSDVAVAELGWVTAGVYSRVQRFCTMEDGWCNASMATIGEKLGLSRKSVYTHLKTLCDKGWLLDLDEGVRNKPHRYVDIGKGRIVIKARRQKG